MFCVVVVAVALLRLLPLGTLRAGTGTGTTCLRLSPPTAGAEPVAVDIAWREAADIALKTCMILGILLKRLGQPIRANPATLSNRSIDI